MAASIRGCGTFLAALAAILGRASAIADVRWNGTVRILDDRGHSLAYQRVPIPQCEKMDLFDGVGVGVGVASDFKAGSQTRCGFPGNTEPPPSPPNKRADICRGSLLVADMQCVPARSGTVQREFGPTRKHSEACAEYMPASMNGSVPKSGGRDGINDGTVDLNLFFWRCSRADAGDYPKPAAESRQVPTCNVGIGDGISVTQTRGSAVSTRLSVFD